MSTPLVSATNIAQYRLNMLTQSAGGVGGVGQAGISPAGSTGAGQTSGPSFGDTLKRALDDVSGAQESARDQVMAATEEAGIALEMLIEIRNKVTEAYRTVINMQS